MKVVFLFALYLFFYLDNFSTLKESLAKDRAILQEANHVIPANVKLEKDLKYFDSLSNIDLAKFQLTTASAGTTTYTSWSSSTGKIRKIEQVSTTVQIDTLMHLGDLGRRKVVGEFPFAFYEFTFSNGKTATYLTEKKQGLIEYSIGADKTSIGYETVDVAFGIAYWKAVKEIGLKSKK
jgi:hypothetical protein